MRNNIPKKYNKPGCCDDCGKKFNPPLSKEMLKYQKKHKNHIFVRVVCDKCINDPHWHTLTDEEIGEVKKENSVNSLIN